MFFRLIFTLLLFINGLAPLRLTWQRSCFEALEHDKDLSNSGRRRDLVISILSKFSGAKQTSIEPPLLLEAVRFPYGPFRFKCRLGKDLSYEIEASVDLKHWEIIHHGNAGEETEVVDPNAKKFRYRFYRAHCSGLFSTNIVGYVTITVVPGFSLLSNPLHCTDPRISNLFKGMPEGTTVNQFNALQHKLIDSSLKNGKWTNDKLHLEPGEGAIVFNASSDYKEISFVGDVPQGNFSTPIPSGFSLRSSVLPLPGRLDTDLGFPISEGDVVHLFDREKQSYCLHPYHNGAWKAEPPVVGVGEAFWIAKTEGRNWLKNISLTKNHL
jgi:hypothetical protein